MRPRALVLAAAAAALAAAPAPAQAADPFCKVQAEGAPLVPGSHFGMGETYGRTAAAAQAACEGSSVNYAVTLRLRVQEHTGTGWADVPGCTTSQTMYAIKAAALHRELVCDHGDTAPGRCIRVLASLTTSVNGSLWTSVAPEWCAKLA